MCLHKESLFVSSAMCVRVRVKKSERKRLRLWNLSKFKLYLEGARNIGLMKSN